MTTSDNLPDHVALVAPTGKLTRDDIKAIVSDVDDKLSRHEQIGMVADVTKLDGISFGGMMEDLSAELKYLGHWNRFPKVAVVAEDGVINDMAVAAGIVLPQVEVRRFTPEAMPAAIAFASEAKG
jgi:hypothetical protein